MKKLILLFTLIFSGFVFGQVKDTIIDGKKVKIYYSKDKDAEFPEGFEVFKKLLEGWGIIELRLSAITTYKDKNFANELVKKAQVRRKQISQKHPELSIIALDYILMHEIHALIDAELVMIGEKFYLPTLREQWKSLFSEQILQCKF